MPDLNTVELSLSNSQGQRTLGHGQLLVWTRQAAMRKAAAWFFACLGVAAIGLLIPLVHFVIVPVCLLAGPVISYLIFRLHNGQQDLKDAQAPCPSCAGDLSFSAALSSWPLHGVCSHCKVSYDVHMISGGGGDNPENI